MCGRAALNHLRYLVTHPLHSLPRPPTLQRHLSKNLPQYSYTHSPILTLYLTQRQDYSRPINFKNLNQQVLGEPTSQPNERLAFRLIT